MTSWEYWWEFNKENYLRRRTHHTPWWETGDDGFTCPPWTRAIALRPTDAECRDVILSALQQALANHGNRDIVSSCLIAIARNGTFGGVDMVDLCAPHLRSRDQEIRETAALAIGIAARGDSRSIHVLTELAMDTREGRRACDRAAVDERTRSFAVYGLGLIANRTANIATQHNIADTLLGLLGDDGPPGRDLRVAAISALGLLNLGRDTAAAALRIRVCDRLLAYFERDLGPDAQQIQAHVPTAVARLLGRHDPRSAAVATRFAAILAATAEFRRSDEVAQSCALALGQMALPGSVAADAVIRASTRHPQQTSQFALIAMGQIGGDRNRAALVSALKDDPTEPWVALALGVLAWQARQDGGEAGTRTANEIGRVLHARFRATGRWRSGALAIALGQAGYLTAAGDLRNRLAESDETVAGHICLGLAMMDDQAAIGPIRHLARLSEGRPGLLSQATVALDRLGDPAVRERRIDPILALIERHLLAVPGIVGDRRCLQRLAETLGDPSRGDRVRAFAAVALGGIGAREPLPWNSVLSTNMNYRAAVATLTNQATGILDIF